MNTTFDLHGRLMLVAAFIMVLVVAAGCEPGGEPEPPMEESCVTCHTSEDTLRDVADEIETVVGTGEG